MGHGLFNLKFPVSSTVKFAPWYKCSSPISNESFPDKSKGASLYGINFTELNEILLKKNICEVLIEAGGKLNASMMKEKLVDEMICIPCGWWVTPEEREYIVQCIKKGW